jgi:hypothetical protein
MNLMSNNNNYPFAPSDNLETESRLRRQISELRDELTSSHALVVAQQDRIAFLETMLAQVQDSRSHEPMIRP